MFLSHTVSSHDHPSLLTVLVVSTVTIQHFRTLATIEQEKKKEKEKQKSQINRLG